MIRRFAVALSVVAASAACAPDSRMSAPAASSAPPSSPVEPAATPASQPGRPPVPETADPGGPNSLTGTWRLAMGRMTWTVRLVPRSGLPGEYLGLGERATRD